MPKYLISGTYTAEGTKGVLKEGGTARRAAVEQMMKGLGAKLEAVYYAFGENDFFLIIDAPDNVTVAAGSLAAAATGAVNPKTTVLLTPEEIDQATKKTVSYRPPGA